MFWQNRYERKGDFFTSWVHAFVRMLWHWTNEAKAHDRTLKGYASKGFIMKALSVKLKKNVSTTIRCV